MTYRMGPLGVAFDENDETSAREAAIVSADVFEMAFWCARTFDERIERATSAFDPDDNPADTVFRLSLDARSGYAVRPDGEIVYVFSRVKGRGDYLVQRAIRDDGTHLDCFDGYLPTLYGRHGFEEVRRERNWTPGGPDVVWMSKGIIK